ncbi:MAG: hypothetical protein AB1798_09695 [Spirochaetota bacterium]
MPKVRVGIVGLGAMGKLYADAMVAAVEKAGVKCMVEFFNRWSPPFTHAKKRIEDGEIGELVTFADYRIKGGD